MQPLWILSPLLGICKNRVALQLVPLLAPREGTGNTATLISSPLLWIPENVGVTLQFHPLFGPPRKQGLCSHFALCPLCWGSPRTPRLRCNCSHFWGLQEGRGYISSLDFGSFVGDLHEPRGCVAIRATFGPLRRHGSHSHFDFFPFVGDPPNVGVTLQLHPLLGPQESRGYVATVDFVLFVRHPQERRGYVAISPTYGAPKKARFMQPLLNLFPFFVDPRVHRGYITIPVTFGSPRMQGLCSHFDCVPFVWGPLRT